MYTSLLVLMLLTCPDNFTNISQEDREVIFHAKQSLLFDEETPWTKKDSHNPFDVTMGAFDGAETCELVGSFLLCQLPDHIRQQVGLYRDDGLGAFKKNTPPNRRDKEKDMQSFFDLRAKNNHRGKQENDRLSRCHIRLE